MELDRSKFKGGSIKSIKETRKEVESKTSNGYSNYLTIDEGINVFRILPPHPGNERPYVPLRRTLLECESEIWENGEPTGETEIKKKSVFISTVHGETEEDIVEIYCDMATKKIEEMVSDLSGEAKKKKRASLLFPIRGGMANGKYQGGIQPSTSYVCYAVKDGKIGRLELYSAWMKRIEELNIDEDQDEEAAIDRFSDPDNGVSLIITKQKRDKKPGWDYILSKREFSPTKYKTWDNFMEGERVTSKQLEELLALTPLEDTLGKNVYRRKDFLLAIDGLQRFDKKYKFGVFEDEDFQAKVLEFDKMFPEEVEQSDDTTSSDDTMDMQGEDFSEWKLPKLRKYIQDYIDTNYPGEKLPSLSKEDLVKWAVLVEQEDELPFEEIGPEESTQSQSVTETREEPVKDEKKVSESSITTAAANRIEQLSKLRRK